MDLKKEKIVSMKLTFLNKASTYSKSQLRPTKQLIKEVVVAVVATEMKLTVIILCMV